MPDRLDSIAVALGKLQSTLAGQVDVAASLVKEAELADRLVMNSRSQLDHLYLLLERLDTLRGSIETQRSTLRRLRSTMAALKPPQR